LIDLLHDVTL